MKKSSRKLVILESAFIVRLLEPYYFNISKRLVKSPKIFIRDTGLLHSLLEIDDMEHLFGNPVIGNSWEGYLKPIMGIEIKFNSHPKISVGNEISMADLGLKHLYVVVPETYSYHLKPTIEVVSLLRILDLIKNI